MTALLSAPFRLVAWALAGAVRAVFRHPWWSLLGASGVVGAVLVVGLALTFQGLPLVSIQRGFRGTGMYEVQSASLVRSQIELNRVLVPYPPVQPAGETAQAAYKNIKVLGDVDAHEFLRLMSAMADWVAPSIGCTYCHSTVNMAEDKVYTKTIARHMIEMTRYINTNWKSHVGEAGVTCNTCHRGHGAPTNVWWNAVQAAPRHGLAAVHTGLDHPTSVIAAGVSALPADPYTPFLLDAAPIRVIGEGAGPSGNRHSIMQTDWTYALMVHFADSLGVNCTYCHNSRAFEEWDQGTPARVTAWHGIEMVRDINRAFMVPITADFPPGRLGPAGDVGKINCATCHQGAYKPFYGASELDAYPELRGPAPTRTTALEGALTPVSISASPAGSPVDAAHAP